MAAGLGFKTFTSGEVLTAADTNGYLMQGILVFANASARTAAVTSPQEGQYSYLKDTNALEYYDGAAWVGAPVGDITAVTAGTGISGGGSSGDVTITNSMATTIDAKGDLIAGTADNAFARLAVGNNGETLVADSSTATGLKWAVPSAGSSYVAGKNLVINGGFDVWQRGTTFASGTRAYTADRFEFFRQTSAAGATLTRQSSGLTTTQYCARVSRDSGNTATNILWLTNSIETANAIPYAGKTITFSFYARAGANYSAASSILNYSVQQGTGTDQNLNAGYTGGTDLIASTNVTLTTSWQRFTASATVASTSTEIGFYFDYTPVGTAGAADYYEITGIQFEAASSATTFSRNGSTYEAELAACQRYYFRNGVDASTLYEPMSTYSSAYSTQTVDPIVVPAPVSMRVKPTSLDYANVCVTDAVTAYSSGTFSLSSFGSKQQLAAKYLHSSSGVLTIYRPYVVTANNSTSAYFGFNAEL